MALLDAFKRRNEEDLILLGRVSRGDQNALGQLYDRYAPLIYTTMLRIVKKNDEAEDLLQEVFMQVWNKSNLFADSKGSVHTWIITIARNKAIDRLRGKEYVHKGESIDDTFLSTLPDIAHGSNPLMAAMSQEYEQLMRAGLALLSDDQRTIIELSYYEGFTQSQISRRMNIPLGTVKTRMRQGIITLRDYLKDKMA